MNETGKDLVAKFQSGVVERVKKHINDKGMPLSKEKCLLREAVYVSTQYGTSKRATYCCKARSGMSLSDWKCVGLLDNRCLFKVANEIQTNNLHLGTE